MINLIPRSLFPTICANKKATIQQLVIILALLLALFAFIFIITKLLRGTLFGG